MLDHALIAAVAFGASALTFVSGFGLGTLLLPAFAAFVPLPVAIAATAVVHLANNMLKLDLVWGRGYAPTARRFIPPAIAGSALGALALGVLGAVPPIMVYALGASRHEITPVKLTLAAVIAIFSLMELLPRWRETAFNPALVPLGGFLSGFFGGLAGHQGALRSAFLLRLGLSKEAFVAIGVLASVAVDATRLTFYALAPVLVAGPSVMQQARSIHQEGAWGLVGTGVTASFLGTLLGRRLMKSASFAGIRILVGVMLLFFAFAVAAGLV
ncbi:MAG: TSUP family transporter [Phycisphaerae bacterium]|nr:TSUP family transporter [Phycisphaerae bacterium]